jgi:adenomatous polyposis coli down-regulated (APCDD)-like protein
MNAEQVKKASLGRWESISPELRPGNAKNADGTLKPFYLTRKFTLHDDETFELLVTNLADPYAKIPIAKMSIRGHIEWKGAHPIADGAQKVDFTADIEYSIAPMIQTFVDVLNKFTNGFDEWKIGEAQNILKKAFPPFGLAEGQLFKEYDLIYTYEEMMFWGARNIDGRGFDTEENRPTNLQIPMVRQD